MTCRPKLDQIGGATLLPADARRLKAHTDELSRA